MKNLQIALGFGLIAAFAAIPLVNAEPAPAADATAFHSFLAETYAQDMGRFPMTASKRGIRTYQDQWNSVSESFLRETRSINEARLKTLEDFDRSALGAEDRLSYDLYLSNLERQLASDDFRHHKFVIQQFRGPHTQLPTDLVNVHRISSVADARAYIARLDNAGPWFDQVIEQLQIRTKARLFLADWQYPQIVQAAGNVVTGAPFDDTGSDSVIWADFNAKVAALDTDAKTRAALRDSARQSLLEVVRPAYERLILALREQGAKAPAEDGVWKFANGGRFYAERLNWFTTTRLSADEIHALGLSEVARIHAEMRAIIAEVEYEGGLIEFFEFLREDAQFYYPTTPEGRAQYLREAARLVDEMYERLPEVFGILPRAELTVKRVEPFREQSAGKAFYQRPPPDGSRPGIFYANLFKMEDMPRYQMAALAYHEGVPGHHMQGSIAVELTGIPEFQKYASFTAYSEGWGLYSEQLAREMGFYPDPYSNFGRLAMELWRAARLVVDTGIHHKKWSREEAIAYLVENTPNSEHDAQKAIERYIAMPGQATAYTIGKLKILELREKARQALGEKFDIREFHDEVLRDGRVPLAILEQKVDRLITRAKADQLASDH